MEKKFFLFVLGAFLICNEVSSQTTIESSNVNASAINGILKQGYELSENSFGKAASAIVVKKDRRYGIVGFDGKWILEPNTNLDEEIQYERIKWIAGNCFMYEKSGWDEEGNSIEVIRIFNVKNGVEIFNGLSKERNRWMLAVVRDLLNNNAIAQLPNGFVGFDNSQQAAIDDGYLVFSTEGGEGAIDRNGNVLISGKRDVIYFGNKLFWTNEQGQKTSAFVEGK